MARPSSQASLSLSQLEHLLQKRRQQIAALDKERASIQRQLDSVDAKLRRLGGPGGGGGAGSRARNTKGLVHTLSDVMIAAGKPLGVGEILELVSDAGYHSTSANFRGIINQTLIKERSRFRNTDRGVYEAIPGGGRPPARRGRKPKIKA